jgi:1-acyl-sn-glycerol-3-phosphate acyltransferase
MDRGTLDLTGLSSIERAAFRVVHWMNRRPLKRLWAFPQRNIGARVVGLACSNLLQVHGFDHVEGASREQPLLLVGNHRSYFDMFVVSSVIVRRTRGWTAFFFPVRGRFFYQSATGVFVNFLFAWWGMYPPFFRRPATRGFDQWALRQLVALCREGRGHVIGFHPEGTRNKGSDPYTLLRAQPGVGQLIKEARPQVIPVFVAGIGNSALRQIRANFTRGEPVRVHFGPPIDFTAFFDKPNRARTYVEIADRVMTCIAELAEQDRAMRTGERREA